MEDLWKPSIPLCSFCMEKSDVKNFVRVFQRTWSNSGGHGWFCVIFMIFPIGEKSGFWWFHFEKYFHDWFCFRNWVKTIRFANISCISVDSQLNIYHENMLRDKIIENLIFPLLEILWILCRTNPDVQNCFMFAGKLAQKFWHAWTNSRFWYITGCLNDSDDRFSRFCYRL